MLRLLIIICHSSCGFGWNWILCFKCKFFKPQLTVSDNSWPFALGSCIFLCGESFVINRLLLLLFFNGSKSHLIIFLLLICWVGDWYSGPATELDTEPDEEWVKNRKDESRAFQEWDEDADIDESGKLCLTLKLLHGALIISVTFNKYLD